MGPPASLVLTLWLPMTAAHGLASRPTRSRSSTTSSRFKLSQVPSPRKRVAQRWDVWCSGKCFGGMRQVQGLRSTNRISLTSSRIGYERRRPVAPASGSRVPVSCHSASVRSLGERSSSRSCSTRVSARLQERGAPPNASPLRLVSRQPLSDRSCSG